MSPNTSPSNVDDPRFAGPEYEYHPDWGATHQPAEWFWRVVEAALEAVPYVVERIAHR